MKHLPVFIGHLITLLQLSSCATTFNSQMSNNPSAGQPSGKRVYIGVIDTEHRPLGGVLGERIREIAIKWFIGHGYVLEAVPRRADSNVMLAVSRKSRTVNVPSQTYSVPVYRPGETVNVNAYNNAGQFVNATAQSSGTWSSTSHHVGAHDMALTDEWLYLDSDKFERGKKPVSLSFGKITTTSYAESLFGNDQNLWSAVNTLLNQSVFAGMNRAPASFVSEPGCWPRLGFSYDLDKEKSGKGMVIKKFSRGSAAKEAGLRIGDTITHIDGYEANSPALDQEALTEGQIVPVSGTREDREITAQVRAVMICMPE